MEGPPLRLPTPFGKGMISVAGRLRRALLKQHITPTQTDGEMLLAMCYAQKDDLPAWVDTFNHLMLGDDLCSWATQEVGWTEDFRWICNLALEEVTPPIEEEDREATSNALAFLLKEVTRGLLPWGIRPRTWDGLRRTEITGLFSISSLRVYPRQLPDGGIGSRGNSKRQIPSPNNNLRKNFAWSGLSGSSPCWLRLLTRSPTWPRSWARTRRESGSVGWYQVPDSRTLTIHSLALENLQAQGFTQVPWTETDVRDHLNRMRAEEASPHKIQRVWETLRWFSKRFGFLKIDACERLMEKKKTLQEEGGHGGSTSEESHPPHQGSHLDLQGSGRWTWPSSKRGRQLSYCGVVRFQVACSARFNDLQHTIPTAYKFHGGTIELHAWQTKTVSAFKSKKSPVPLLAPTGRDWWTPLMRTWDKMKDLEKFKDLDFIIPTLSKDSTGIIPRPSAADRALRWLKAALHRNWSTVSSPDILHKLTWRSFRVFVPDCAYQLGFPRDQRQYLGNWTTETTADIYARDKRHVVEKVWKAVGDKMGILKLDNPQAERRIDLNHEDWADVVDVEDETRRQLNLDALETPIAEPSHLAEASDGPFKRRKHTPPSTGNSSWSLISGGQELPPPLGPLRVVSASKKKSSGQYTVHLLTQEGKAVGCGWEHRQPRPWTFPHRISLMTWTLMLSATGASRSTPSRENGVMR